MRIRPEVSAVRESPMVQVATIAESMPDAIKLCYGESDLPTPKFIRDAAARATEEGHTFYTHTAGYAGLREAIAAKVFELHGVEYTPAEIMSTVGATAAIFTAVRACVGPGDNAVIIAPTYAIFSNAVVMTGAEPRQVPLRRDGARLVLDLDRVRRAIDADTRLLIVNSPSNPTGWVISVEEQRALCELAERHDLVILTDDVYERLYYDGPVAPSFARIAPDKDRLIVVNSFSKTYNMTGWRLGWAQASARTIHAMYKAAEFITSNPAAMVQQAGIVALRDGESYIAEVRAHYAARLAQVRATFARIAGVTMIEPRGAFYAFFAVDDVTDSTAFTADVLRATGVALTPGLAFGDSGEGFVRLCLAVREETLAEALKRFAGYMTTADLAAVRGRRA